MLLEHLETIERVVAFTCRRSGLDGADAEDFASAVKLKLVEDDYGIIRKFEGRSSFCSFISVVVQRLLSDDRNHRWGKWHASAEARRIGDVAIELEKLIRRDGRTMDEAVTVLIRAHDGVTREQLQDIASRLPSRAPRRRFVDLDEAVPVARTEIDEAEKGLMEAERQTLSSRMSATIRGVLQRLPEDDQLILQLRFESGMTVAQIARSLHLDQKVLYRRIERHMASIREALERDGLGADAARELMDHGMSLDLDLGKHAARPSNKDDAITAAHGEISG